MNAPANLELEPSRTTNQSPQVDAIARNGAIGFDLHLRGEAIDVDAQRGSTDELVAVWLGLLRGELVVADSFYTEERWYAALAPSATARPLEPSNRRLLMHLLLGESQKQTALGFGISDAGVSSALHRILARLGVPDSPCKAPPFLALMARAGIGTETVLARFSTLRHEPFEYRIVSVARPELQLAPLLSRAQYAVLCRYVEGRTHAEIARERCRSERTVANQVATLFRRLGVSGRGELIARLVSDVSSKSSRNERSTAYSLSAAASAT